MKRPFIFEHKSHRVASKQVYSQRLMLSGTLGFVTIAVALAIGMAGYMGFESMGIIDAFENASMILSGMGPVTQLQTDGGKIFAGFYALFSGLLLIAVAGLIFAPVVHRMLHKFHVDDNDQKN
jgi:hypothetical protein